MRMPKGFRISHLGAVLLYGTVAAGSFSSVYVVRRHVSPPASRDATGLPGNDTVRLARMGLPSGVQLVAFVLVSSECGFCRSKPVRSVLSSLKAQLQERYGSSFARIAVIGVSIDSDIRDGMRYFDGMDLRGFDEIDSGNGWMNEEIIRHVWRDATTEALVPQIVMVSRRMQSELHPFSLHFAKDSLLRVVQGSDELRAWARAGMPLGYGALVTHAGASAPSQWSKTP